MIINLSDHVELRNQNRLNAIWNQSDSIHTVSDKIAFYEKVLRDFISAELKMKSLIDESNADTTKLHSGWIQTNLPLDGIRTENFDSIANVVLSKIDKTIGFIDRVAVGRIITIVYYYKWRVPELAL